jgi:hypothetical protein
MKEALSSSETTILTRAMRRNIPEVNILYKILLIVVISPHRPLVYTEQPLLPKVSFQQPCSLQTVVEEGRIQRFCFRARKLFDVAACRGKDCGLV